MRSFSQDWLDALRLDRYCSIPDNLSGPSCPIMPWIPPPVPLDIRQAFATQTHKIEYEPGELLFNRVQVRNFIFIESGLTGRILGSINGPMAVSPPMRIGAGNLNWVTSRAAIGRYFAISQVKAGIVSHAAVEEMTRSNGVDFSRKLSSLIELINLSDRLAFAALLQLSALDRYKALLVSWAFFFGKFHQEGDTLYAKVPLPARRQQLAKILNVSLLTVDVVLTELKKTADYHKEGDFISFQCKSLQQVHDWMRCCDGEEAYMGRPKFVEEMFLMAQDQDSTVL